MSVTTIDAPTLPPRFVRPNIGKDPERRRAVQRPLQDLDTELTELSDQAGRLLAIAFRSGIDRDRALRAHEKCLNELRALRDAYVSACWRWVHGRSELLPRPLSCGAAGGAFDHLIEVLYE